MESKVDMLKKITVSISPAATSTVSPGTSASFHCEFIYGIGPNGLTPFEYALAGKTVGEAVCITLHPSEAGETFQHLSRDIPVAAQDQPPASYTVRILRITSADTREIVSAMANVTSCTGCCGH